MLFLRQSSAIYVKIGPFVDVTDGVTPEAGLTINQADVRLSKNGNAFAQKNDANSATHDENGWYRCALNATDTGTLGQLQLAVYESGALPVWHEYMVVPANVHDSLFGSDLLHVDQRELSGDSIASDNMEADYDGSGYNKSASTIGTVTAVSSAGRNSIADTVLTYDWTSISSFADRCLLQAVRWLRNRKRVDGGTMTVYREDDSTSAWTAAVTDDSAADPITEVDPN